VTVWDEMRQELSDLQAADLLRRPAVVESACGPRVVVGGREVLCLCGNDYLGLANDPAIKSAVVEAVGRWGVGAGASRLVSGTTSLHVELERRLAEFKHAEAALVTPTGWMANHVAIHALTGPGDLILCDKLNHASIIDAALSSGARVRTYAHREVDRAADLLDRHRGEHRRCVIVTDSLFSMDGDLAPLPELVGLKERFDAMLLIDEAHATGVLGEHGRGAAELLGVEDRVDATVGTLSKAVGALGGFVSGPKVLIDTIVSTGRAFMFTTALPPALCAAAIAALDIIRDQPDRRRRLLDLAARLRWQLSQIAPEATVSPMDVTNPERERRGDVTSPERKRRDEITQIIPILIGEAAEALRVSNSLLEAGFLVPAIRPPTVPRRTSRLRVSLTAAHEQADLDRFVEALGKVLPGRT